MRKAAGSGAGVLSRETPARIAAVVECGVDDPARGSRKESPACAEAAQCGISRVTARNWERLNTESAGRLTTRANKRNSPRRILPVEYVTNKDNLMFVRTILDYIDEHEINIMSALYSLGVNLLKKAQIYHKSNVAEVLGGDSNPALIDDLATIDMPEDEFDLLGLIYQSYLREGEKNIAGSYYTPQKIACNMTKEFAFSHDELFFDPCCGSGAFLLSVAAKNPNQIFGIDNDPVAVFLARVNLLLKYRDFDFIPQIYCLDFLQGASGGRPNPVFHKTFDYIATNPPWGAVNHHSGSGEGITFSETFSAFFVKACGRLKKSGTIRFLFPEAILKVRAHREIRNYILHKAGLKRITVYDDMFAGVTTKYVDMECGNGAANDRFEVRDCGRIRTVDKQTVHETGNLNFNLWTNEDISIVRIVKDMGKFSLRDSIWALGIVTGDNQGKLFSEHRAGMEKIYTGKEIQPYLLRPAGKYIRYDRASLQQVAKEAIYRAPEKLAYKFISSKLVFAYDDRARLFLNSANLLIPNIPGMSIKTVMAFLNSTLFQFMYLKLFGDVKILKGNLSELPFPGISKYDNERLSALVDEVLSGNGARREAIENSIYSIYHLTDEQISHVRRETNGKMDRKMAV